MNEERIEELQDSLLFDCDVEEWSEWRHYKGNVYTVVTLALDANSHEKVVIYQDVIKGYVWTRPLSEWLEMVDCEGVKVKRFTRLD